MKQPLVLALTLALLLPPSAPFAESQDRESGGSKPGGGKPSHHQPPQAGEAHQPGGKPHHKPSTPSHPHASHHRRGGSHHGHGGSHHRPPHGPPPPQHRGPLPPRSGQFYHHGRWYGRVHGPAYVYPNGWRYRRWVIGAHLPALFLAPTYVYPDYVALGLPRPPPGYSWVRYGPDLLLVNLQTGIVDDVVYGAFY